ncbi:hypothetical protein NDN08_004978 [Rhodosorus marinus]|uniref:Uncharacterized protein n=1 Tax=Rhodosorus marinus TaxID=101924 RepID=A0AAV8UJ91_9RHOD|nr:hypothetical protein NDN08_004978 [Rhodosorus marinus]
MSEFAYSGVSNGEGGAGGSGTGAMAIASRFIPTAEGLKDSVLGSFSKAQPWGEFANIKQFNILQASEPLSLVSVALVILGDYRLFVMAGEDPVKPPSPRPTPIGA